jgi:hypothetical protein
MAMNTLEPMFTRSAAVGLEERKLGDIDVGRMSTEMPVATFPFEHRCEARMDYRRLVRMR